MRLTVIGRSGPYPEAGGACSCYLLDYPGGRALLDLGTGGLPRLMGMIDPAELNFLWLSHLHFDHCSDALTLRYYLERWGKTLSVYVPREAENAPILDFLRSSAISLKFIPESGELSGLSVRSMITKHPVPCRAGRFEYEGSTLVYTGDTGACEGLADFCDNADLLLCDGAFPENEWTEENPHLSASAAARLAKEARVKRLCLTHFSPAHPEEEALTAARAIFPSVTLAKLGLTLDI